MWVWGVGGVVVGGVGVVGVFVVVVQCWWVGGSEWWC